MGSAVKQAIQLQLVDMSEIKLTLRPRSQTIPNDVQVVQVVVWMIIQMELSYLGAQGCQSKWRQGGYGIWFCRI